MARAAQAATHILGDPLRALMVRKSAAVAKRVEAGKTLDLGPMTDGLAHALRSTFTASCIFQGRASCSTVIHLGLL